MTDSPFTTTDGAKAGWRAAGDAGAPSMIWRPIKSAPKDGTRILAFQNWEAPHQPNWVDPDKRAVVAWWNGRGWQDVEDHHTENGRGHEAPMTHWMPLPPPPPSTPAQDDTGR